MLNRVRFYEVPLKIVYDFIRFHNEIMLTLQPYILEIIPAFPAQNTISSAQKAPAGGFSDSKYNPNTLTRMPPTQYPLSGKAAPPPNSRDAFPSLQQGADPLGWAQGDPREPKGTQGYLRAPWGGWAHGAPWGYTEAIPNGTRFD